MSRRYIRLSVWVSSLLALLLAAACGPSRKLVKVTDGLQYTVLEDDSNPAYSEQAVRNFSLALATDRGLLPAMKELLEAGADPNTKAWADFDFDQGRPRFNCINSHTMGFPILSCAVKNGNLEAAKLLLQHGASQVDLALNEALMQIFECDSGMSTDLVRLLLAHGANPNAGLFLPSSGILNDLLGLGDSFHDLDKLARVAVMLVEYGADLDKNDRGNGTPLSIALWRGFNRHDYRLLWALLEAIERKYGSDALAKRINKESILPRFLSAQTVRDGLVSDAVQRIDYLINKGADINATAEGGIPLICFFVGEEKPKHEQAMYAIAMELLRAGAKANVICSSGNSETALHEVAAQGPVKLVEALLKNGADPNARDKAGFTPYSIAWISRGENSAEAKLLAARMDKALLKEETAKFHAADQAKAAQVAPRAASAPVATTTPGRPAALPMSQRTIVAVFDVEIRGLHLPRSFGRELGDLLSTKMVETGRFQVVPRDSLKSRLVDAKRDSYKECFSQRCQIELGQELAAEKTLSACITKLGSKCDLSMTLYDLKRATGEGGVTARSACSQDALIEQLSKLVVKLSGQ